MTASEANHPAVFFLPGGIMPASTLNGELSFQLSDAPAGRQELGALPGGQSNLESLVDPLLPSPVVHRLIADAQVAGDISDAPSRSQQTKDPLVELRGIAASCHAVLLLGQQHDIPVIRLHQTQGALCRHPTDETNIRLQRNWAH